MQYTEGDWLSYDSLLGSDVPTPATLSPDIQLSFLCRCGRTTPMDRDELTRKHGNAQTIKSLKLEFKCGGCGKQSVGSWRIAKTVRSSREV